jgi:hypothetical protein
MGWWAEWAKPVLLPANGSFSSSEYTVNGNDTVELALNSSSRKAVRNGLRRSLQLLTKLQRKSPPAHPRPTLVQPLHGIFTPRSGLS